MKGLFNKLKENKQIFFALCGVLVLIIIIAGTTYAVFNYSNNNASNNDINSGHISMNYTEPSNEYVVDNALPMKDEEGMNSTNYFEFSVTTKANPNDADDEGVSIPYEISITELEGNTLTNDKVKMYITEVEGGIEHVNTSPTLVSYFESSLYKDGQIKVGFNLHLHKNGNQAVTTKYRLRAWVDYDTDVSDWDTAGEFVYKFRVNVNGEATYQGYETDPSCFVYNSYGSVYAIVGYDDATCGSKNIVIPTEVEEETTDIILLDIDWSSNEEFIEKFKNYAYDQGMCSVDVTWEECLAQDNGTEADLLADYSEFKAQMEPKYNQLIGGNIAFIEDSGMLEELYEYEQMGFYTLEWTDGTPTVITRKITGIMDFSYYDSDNKINNLIVPEDIIIYDEGLDDVEIDSIIDRKGNFPSGCFTYASDGNAITIDGSNCRGVKNLRIPANIENLPVRKIEGWTFYNDNMESVRFPDTIETIGSSAFAKNKLVSVVMPTNLITVGAGAFMDNEINYLVLGDNIQAIYGHAFYNNQLTSVVMPDSVKTIEEYAFSNNQLTSVVIPDNVTSIDEYAFSKNQLTDVTIGNGVKHIGKGAFGNNLIKNVIIGNSVTHILEGAFSNNQLKEVIIPESVTDIGKSVFYKSKTSNPNLTKIINKTGRTFSWSNIIGSLYGDVEIVSE